MRFVITESILTEAVDHLCYSFVVVDEFISITIKKFKLWISFELKLKLTIPSLFSYSYY